MNALRGWLRKRLADTLAKRLFLLMWVALVVSHLVAFAVINLALGMGGSAARPPPFPSLPPGPSVLQGGPQGMRQPGGGEPRPPDPFDLGGPDRRWGERQDDFMEGPGNGPGRLDQGGGPRHGFSLPTEYLLLDYGIRLLIIALAAALGARWVARPMADLVKASRELGPALDSAQQRLPLLDEHEGTVEVREAAHVFNTMAQRLKRQFVERGLMVAAISHDLRTPLARLRLETEMSVNDEVAREHMVADIVQLDATIDKFLDYARPDHVTLTPVNLHAVISSCVYAVQDHRELQITMQVPEDLNVLADEVERGLDRTRRSGLGASEAAMTQAQQNLLQGIGTNLGQFGAGQQRTALDAAGQQAALGKLSQIAHQQAAIMAYNDAFHFVGLALGISMIAVLLTRALPPGTTGGAAH